MECYLTTLDLTPDGPHHDIPEKKEIDRFCINCKHCTETPSNIYIYKCNRKWADLVTGEEAYPDPIYCWHARESYCGVTGIGWEPKD